jgi:hypothetical protein
MRPRPLVRRSQTNIARTASNRKRWPQVQQVGECFAPNKLHRDKREAIVFTDVIDRDDVRMAQAARCGGFAGKAIADFKGIELWPELLDGDVAANTWITGSIERAHSATTDQFDDLVTPEASWNLHKPANVRCPTRGLHAQRQLLRTTSSEIGL